VSTVVKLLLSLFHRDALGEVARLIDIASQLDGEVVSEKLQWNHSENGTKTIDDVRNLDDVIGEVF